MILRGEMRSSFKSFRAACGALALLALPACSDGPKQTGTVDIIHWWNAGGEAEAIGALLGVFKDQNPGVEVVDSSVPGGSNKERDNVRDRMMMGLPPDTFQANGGWDLMAWVLYNGDPLQNMMQPIDSWAQDWLPHVPPKVVESVSYLDRTPNSPNPGLHYYGVPLNIHRVNTLFYNKELFARMFAETGFDAVARLTSLEGLFEVADKVKAYNEQEMTAVAPIAVGYGDKQFWTLGLLFFENVLVSRMGGKFYQDLFWEPKDTDPFSPEMTYALEDFHKVMSYANDDADKILWDEAMGRVMTGKAAMTIMGDWGKGYANAALGPEGQPAGYYADMIGFMPMPGTTGTFMFTTDTFGLPKSARHPEEAQKLLTVFGSPEGQQTFNRLKGSISARLDLEIALDDERRPTYEEFVAAKKSDQLFAATSILAQQTYFDAISAVLGTFATSAIKGSQGSISEVQHALDNYADLIRKSCWPKCQSMQP